MNIILPSIAAPIYKFLSMMNDDLSASQELINKRILECGAGGPVPPLALFAQHRLKTVGVDISHRQIQLAQDYFTKHGLEVDLVEGDMRNLEIEDETFDYVYEHYSLCHLNREDTQKAINEMYRVLKKGGLCFIGVISIDTWPKSLLGVERTKDEYVDEEHGFAHYVYDDVQAEKLVKKFDIIHKEKIVKFLADVAEGISIETWENLYDKQFNHTEKEWAKKYRYRANYYKSVYLYYYLKKI